MSERRSERLELRLSAAERDVLLAAAGPVNLGTWVRAKALDAAAASPLPGALPVERLTVSHDLPSADSLDVPDAGEFECPASGCDFRAGSAKARCPRHGRTVR